jgi:hypothetical protein
LTYTSIWLQSFLGLSPIEAGLTGVPLSASSFLVSIHFGRFLHGSAPGPITGGGFILIGGGALFVSVAGRPRLELAGPDRRIRGLWSRRRPRDSDAELHRDGRRIA